mmetsp:Transcript_4473/g.6316  ORF Transcript_4473/g.6316 Transcript_4473/m.6316 type:complete len:136 (-) Transcript_4473:22-429(-)
MHKVTWFSFQIANYSVYSYYNSVLRSIGNTEVSDQVIVDFSPLRKKSVNELVVYCMEALSSFNSSVTQTADNSKIDDLGWGDLDKVFDEEPIWRIPVFSFVATFSVRSDCKKYAEKVALDIAEGQRVNVDVDDSK